ncbi:MAG: NAD-dependent epimerase/dehydratase family protein [Candidatus Calescibacterium sp.]|nr:NAD-dependent epimerase/dehydratase family protein [Candidatus Calescibacterium sp.]MDW8132808.1 NAD-dependent epimerase/dehydratase family protein [Candidatus Calescibacterium sp.]
MKNHILFFGYTGLIGNQIYKHIKQDNYDKIFCFTRKRISPPTNKTSIISYTDIDIDLEKKLENVLQKNEGKWTIFLFTGETIFGFINSQKWKNIFKTRIDINKKVISTLEKFNIEVSKIFSASAIGIYYQSPHTEVTENTEPQDNIVSNLVKDWENTVLKSNYVNKSVIMRLGAVLDKNSKIYQSLSLPSLMSIGINFTPNSFFPWIYNKEIPLIIEYLMKTDFSGILNTVCDNYITYREFLENFITNHSFLKKSFIIDIPKKILEKSLAFLMPSYYELIYSLFCSPKVIPQNLINLGYRFKFNNIKDVIKTM